MIRRLLLVFKVWIYVNIYIFEWLPYKYMYMNSVFKKKWRFTCDTSILNYIKFLTFCILCARLTLATFCVPTNIRYSWQIDCQDLLLPYYSRPGLCPGLCARLCSGWCKECVPDVLTWSTSVVVWHWLILPGAEIQLSDIVSHITWSVASGWHTSLTGTTWCFKGQDVYSD